MNIRQANGIGRVHVAMPGMQKTYCGRSINDEDWVTTTGRGHRAPRDPPAQGTDPVLLAVSYRLLGG
jgi:hypothetical protein